MKTALHFILLWLAALLITTVFIVPNTSTYRTALQKFDQAVVEKKLDLPAQEGPFRFGFAVGYIIGNSPLFIVTLLGIQTAVVILIFIVLKRIPRPRTKNILLPDPLDSVKNVLSNLLLFIFGVFNNRASGQLRFYFDLPARSRFIGLLAYATIFIAINISYNVPKASMSFRFILISFLQILIVIVLLCLVFFCKPFRVNYQRKLFWLSLSGLALVWVLSGITGYQMGQAQMDGAQSDLSFSSFIETKTLFINLLIVMAFSFYIEVMKQLSTQKARVDAEMSVAQRIQNELLPILEIEDASLSLYGRTESANEVGGDYCDAIHLPDGRYAVAVGDVSGHNVAAGVMMSMLKIAFRTELAYLDDPAALASSLNRTVYDHKIKNMFISFLMTLVDPSDKSLILFNCGHPPLLHFSREERIIKEYSTGDVALGLQRDSAFQSRTIRYKAGDVFILLSDGLIETVNTAGEEFDADTLYDLLTKNIDRPPNELVDLLTAAAQTFRGQLAQRDDITIVVSKMG